jgi:hypothetical protein
MRLGQLKLGSFPMLADVKKSRGWQHNQRHGL